MAPRITGERVVYARGPRRYLALTLTTAGGAELERRVDDHGDAVAVLPYDAGRRLAVLTRQLRAPSLWKGEAEPFLEALAGMIDPGEAPRAAAVREAAEETGLKLAPGVLEPVVNAWSSPGVCTERIALYLAPYAQTDRAGEGGGLAAEHEEIEVVELPLAELAAAADRGGLVDLKTLALVQALRLRRPELFPG